MDWIAALIAAGASIISGLTGANAAGNAARTQTNAINAGIKLQQQGLEFQQRAYNQAREDAMPWLTAGKNALAQYQGELGLSPNGADGTPFKSQFKETPGYQFAVDQGERGVVNNLGALGLRGSGAALKALTKFRTGLADQTYQTYLDRLSGVSTGGQVTGAQNSANSQNAANSIAGSLGGIGQSMANAGSATASGYVGGANAWSGALGNFANNIGSYLGQRQQTGWAV